MMKVAAPVEVAKPTTHLTELASTSDLIEKNGKDYIKLGGILYEVKPVTPPKPKFVIVDGIKYLLGAAVKSKSVPAKPKKPELKEPEFKAENLMET
tara:strand:+ start:183 stop:470 length:288 start_codon:yes stop_codon:yes gene_type:complete